MISSVSSSSAYSSSTQNYSMSDLQKESVSEILSQYDADSLTSEEALEIIEAFKELGIRPSAELKSVMEESGFDAEKVRELGGAEGDGTPPPPPPPYSNNYQEEFSYFEEVLLDLLSDNSLVEERSSGLLLDYTSKIMNLNDSAKDEVEALFEKLSIEDNEYTQKEINQIVIDSLDDILDEYSNYRGISVYA